MRGSMMWWVSRRAPISLVSRNVSRAPDAKTRPSVSAARDGSRGAADAVMPEPAASDAVGASPTPREAGADSTEASGAGAPAVSNPADSPPPPSRSPRRTSPPSGPRLSPEVDRDAMPSAGNSTTSATRVGEPFGSRIPARQGVPSERAPYTDTEDVPTDTRTPRAPKLTARSRHASAV